MSIKSGPHSFKRLLNGRTSRWPLGVVSRERPDPENDGAGGHIKCPRRTRPPGDERQHDQRDPNHRFHNTMPTERERLPAALREFCRKGHREVDAGENVGEDRCRTGKLDDSGRECEGDHSQEVENAMGLRTQDSHLIALRELGCRLTDRA